MELEDTAYFAGLIRVDWAAIEDWGKRRAHLHALPYGPWTREQAEDIAYEWRIEHPTLLACGRITRVVQIPGIISRDPKGGMPRCPGCCAATGIPVGRGAPKNSDEARLILGLDPAGESADN